jgi:LPXTG-motif cell wall-anchored protein
VLNLGKNNQQRRMIPERKNYKLYKAKKQWITACATALLAFGTTALMNVSASADTNSTNRDPETEIEAPSVKDALNSRSPKSNSSASSSTNKGQLATQQTSETAQTSVATNAVTSSAKAAPLTKTITDTAKSQDNGQTTASSASTVKSGLVQPATTSDQINQQSSQQTTADKSANHNDQSAASSVKVPVPVMPHADSSENAAPVAWTDDVAYVVVDTNLTNLASKFLQNGAELEAAGAKITWVGDVPKPTQADIDSLQPISGKVRVQYADGTSKEVEVGAMVEPHATITSNTFYYVNNVGDRVDSATAADANGRKLWDQDDSSKSVLNTQDLYDPGSATAKLLAPLDTSTIGIHWAEVQVTDTSVFWNGEGTVSQQVIGTPYIVKLPYVVKTLKLKDDIPMASGDPTINAQLATSLGNDAQLAFNLGTGTNTNVAMGEYFYQDYALAVALGIVTKVSNWTAPTDLKNTKENHFTLTLAQLPNAPEQNVQVKYISDIQVAPIYIYNQGTTYTNGLGQNSVLIKQLIADGEMNGQVHIVLPDGTKLKATDLSNLQIKLANRGQGIFKATFTVGYNGVNKAGQPNVFTGVGNINALPGFNDQVNKWYAKLNNTNKATYQEGMHAQWTNASATITPLQPSIAQGTPDVVDISNGPIMEADNQVLSTLVKNPADPQRGYGVTKPNQFTDANGNKLPEGQWPEGTKFEWAGKDGAKKLVLDKAGETRTGDVKITLPSGSTYTVKNITVVSRAKVKLKNETVDYGTKLTAKDLVTNLDVFPEGTTFQYIANEPKWTVPGSYNTVTITATYPTVDENGNPITGKDATITTDPAKCDVAVNGLRTITVLEGTTDIPSASSVLNLPTDWAAHDTPEWVTTPNSTQTNEGEIKVHYTESGLDQTIKVYVNVIPRTSLSNVKDFFTNGNRYDGQTGSIANGVNQGGILTKANGNAINYQAYTASGQSGKVSTITKGDASYTPTYSLSGLQTNTDGSLASGKQNVTIKVYVPKGTIGAKTDDQGSYYELKDTVNVAQKVKFQFVDQYHNDAPIENIPTYSQEFIPGVQANLNFRMQVPNGYELASGTSIPTSYTLAEFTKNPITVNVLIHQKMHFYITFHDEDSKKDLGTVEIADNWNGGYHDVTSQLHLPAGVNVNDYESVSASGVPEGVTLAASYWDPFSKENATWWIPNCKWDKTLEVESKLCDATMTINLKHKTTVTQEQQERTATVHYIYANGNYAGQSANPNATATFMYTREKTHDDVTKKDTYTDWKFDNKFNNANYKNGISDFHQGQWTINNGTATVTVPTNDGYTATDSGDWTDNQNAAEFNFDGKDALTDTATSYGQKKDHTIYYVQNKTESRTITEYYRAVNDDGTPGEELQAPSHIDVHLKKDLVSFATNGSTDPTHFTIKYADNWTTAYAINDPKEYSNQVGSWDWSSNSSIRNAFPVNITKDGKEYHSTDLPNGTNQTNVIDGGYDTAVFNLVGDLNTAFTAQGEGQKASSQTIFYLRDDQVQQEKKRTIEVTKPGETETETYPAGSATLTRTAKRVLNGFDFGDWNTGSWTATDQGGEIPGYSRSIEVSTDGGQTWTAGTAADLGKVTVTNKTKNTIVKVTYGAVATAKLTGNGSSTYNGSAITNADLTKGIHVVVNGPTASSGTYKLQAGDVEFSSDGGNTWTKKMPINADTYQVRLSTQGEDNIKDQFGNNSIVWTQDGKSTITSDATYIIKKLEDDSVMANAETGNYEMTYNGAAPSSIDASKFKFTITVNGQTVNLDAAGLTSADFAWVDGQAPKDVGTYQIKLTDAGLTKLQANNSNFILKNTGNGTFTINQADASATLAGSGTRPYNGQAVTVDDLNVSDDHNNITLTLHYPKDGNSNYSTTVNLTADDFTWNTLNGQAPTAANTQPYTITIKADAVQKIIEQAVGKGQNGVSNVKFANGAITGTANYTITPLETNAELVNVTEGNYSKVYDAQVTNQIDSGKFQITANVDGQPVVLNMDGITGGSYQWVDEEGNPLTDNPKNVGTYYVKLTDTAFAHLQAENPNFKLSNTGLGVYTITQADATGTLSGSNSKVYDGSAITTGQLNNNGDIKVSLNFPGVNGQTYTLKQNDYTISGNATDADDYTITLTTTGVTNVENYIKSLAGTGQNSQSNVKFADNAISGTANFTITASKNVVSVGGIQTETYKGSPYNVVYKANGDNSVTVSIAKAAGNNAGALASLTNVHLDSDDFKIVNGPAKNVNSYKVALTDAGLAKIKQALGKNYEISVDQTAFGTLKINKYQASAKLTGDPSQAYTGNPIADYLSKYHVALDEPNASSYSLVAGDLEFNVNGHWVTEAPVNAGKYDVRLSQAGWNHIKAINSANVEWPTDASAGTGTYTITQAKVTTELSGSNSMTYTGSAVTTADLYADGSTIKVVISGTGISNLPQTFELKAGDYVWQTIDGQAPKNVGTYTIKLTAAGINNIQKQINQAVGEGNVALITTADKAGTADFEIKQAVAENVQLYGDEKSTYDGNQVKFDPTKADVKNNFGFHNVAGLTIPEFTSADFDWFDKDGNPISAPTNAGHYILKLNAQGEKKFADANTNYTFVKDGKSTITGQINYIVDPAELVITVAGSASKVFDNQPAKLTQAQIDAGDIKLVWGNSDKEPTGLGQFNLTPADFEIVDADGQPAVHANVGKNVDGTSVTGTPYQVRLTVAALEKIKALSGASNYTISQSKNHGDYYIYEHRAELTLTGNQTTVYGTYLPFDPSAYTLDFSNWLESSAKPKITWQNGVLYVNGQPNTKNVTWQAGDLYVDGYPDGSLPTNVGSYQVKISKHLTDELRQLFPDYDFSGNIGRAVMALLRSSNSSVSDSDVEASHEPASYVITPATTTVMINGAEHVKYVDGETPEIKYGDNGYTLSITAPVKPEGATETTTKQIYTDVQLSNDDLEFVTTPGDVGTYQVKLSAKGLQKLQKLTGSTNYDWTQASDARANFIVDQMPVTITVGGEKSVDYGSTDWLTTIKEDPQVNDYTLTVKTENGSTLTYQAQPGDLVFNQTPGNVGPYQVALSAQGLAHIKTKLGTNYAYPQDAVDVTTHGTLTVKQGEVTVTLTGNDGKTYDAKETVASELNPTKYNLGYSVVVYSPDGQSQTLTLAADDLQIVGDATNVGTYQVELSANGQSKLKNLTGNNGDNYKWTFTPKAHYMITAATAQADLSGSNEKIFNGLAVTTPELNSNGQILVHFTYPGSTEQSTYTLQEGDYTWVNGSAPTNVGTYTINLDQDQILQHLQDRLKELAGTGQDGVANVTISTNDLTGQASFTITPKEISNVTISGDDQSKVYNGQGANLDVNGLTIKADGTLEGTPLVDTGLTADDFDWYSAAGKKLENASVNVGSYQARLKDSFLDTLKQKNPNYSFDAAQGVINYDIKPAPATVTIGNSASRDYDGKSTSAADVQVSWNSTGFVTGENLNHTGVTASDYTWYTKNANGTYTIMTGEPTNAGTYYLKLNDGAIAQIKRDNPNYSFANDAFTGEFTYTINAVAGTATLSGQNSKTYDGQDISLADLNSTDGNIEVKFAFPGSTDSDTYQLQSGDYTIGHNAAKVGNYTIKLSDQGLANLQAALDKYAGNGNVTLDADSLQGSASFKINPKVANVTLSGNDDKTYDGQPAVINPDKGSLTAEGLINGQGLNTTGLTAGDYEWVDAQGNKIDAPTDAGTYYIRLTKAGLDQLQADNPNYQLSESGRITYVISPAEAKVKIAGFEQETTAKINAGNYHLDVPAGVTVPDGLEYEFASTPNQSGTYLISLTPASMQKLIKANPNYDLKISSTAEFELDATLTIEFQDADENNKQVGKTITKTGVADSTINNLGLTIPNKYELAQGQTLPGDYTFGTSLEQHLYIKLVHKTKQDTQTKDVTRTINYEGLIPDQLSQIPDSQKKQTVEFSRTVKTDLVTGKTVPGSWTPGDGQFTFVGFTPKQFNGLVADKVVANEVVTPDSKNSSITITYKAVPEPEQGQQVIHYVDADEGDRLISAQTVTGTEDSQIDFTPEVPANYEPVGKLPSTIMIKGGITTIALKHKTQDISDSKTVTRTIIDELPSGTKTITQKVTITHKGVLDLVTNVETWDPWTTATLAEYVPEVPDGYTASISDVPEETVTDKTQNSTVKITYKAISQPQENQQVIQYVDDDENGRLISTQVVEGTEGSEVTFTPEIPANYEPVGDVPKKVTIAAGITKIHLKHKTTRTSQTRDVTRTIIEKFPFGTSKTKTQTVTLTETGIKDLVTGKTKWNNDWKTGEWSAFTPDEVPGYNADPTSVAAEKVTGETKDKTVKITYAPNEQTGKISYQDKDGKEITSTPLSGKTDEQINVDPVAPAGWEIIPGQDIPKTVIATANGIPTVIVKVQRIVIPPVPETATEKVQFVDESGNVVASQDYSGDLGQTIPVELTVPAGYKLAAGQELPTEIKIENGVITIKVVTEGSDHPDHPDQPVNPDHPVNPDQPVNPDHPDNPNQPVTPDHPENNGDNAGKPGEGGNVPGHGNANPGHIANDNSISSQINHHANGNHNKTNQLPQTGNTNNEKAATLGFLFAGLASIFGLTGLRKKKK